MNCTNTCPLPSEEVITSLSAYLPVLFVIAYVYTVFTRNAYGAVASLVPFWIIAWTYPIRQYSLICNHEHIVKEFFLHVWASYALGIFTGLATTISFHLPMLYDDKLADPDRKLSPFDKDDDDEQKKPPPLKHYDLKHIVFLTCAVGIYFGVKLIRGHYLEGEKCLGFLDNTQANIWGAFFLILWSVIAIATFFWCLFRRYNLYSNRSNLKYGTGLFLFLMLSIIVFEVAGSNGSVWFGLFYLVAVLIFFVCFYFWIGYVGMGIIYYSNTTSIDCKASPQPPISFGTANKRFNFQTQPVQTSQCKEGWEEIYDGKSEKKEAEAWWYKQYLYPFYADTKEDEISHVDRIGTKKIAFFMCTLMACIVFVTFLIAWIVHSVTDADADSVLFTLFALSLFYILVQPLMSICINVHRK